jgi:hypothetical protein
MGSGWSFAAPPDRSRAGQVGANARQRPMMISLGFIITWLFDCANAVSYRLWKNPRFFATFARTGAAFPVSVAVEAGLQGPK